MRLVLRLSCGREVDLSAREVEAELYSLFYRMPAQRAALRLAQSMVRGPRTKGDYMELFADMTIIALTGWGQEQDRHKSGEAGFSAHLVKPLAPASLLKVVADLQARLP